jgi:hypothetical protein
MIGQTVKGTPLLDIPSIWKCFRLQKRSKKADSENYEPADVLSKEVQKRH